MTPEEVLQGLYDETLVGNAPRVLELTKLGIEMDMGPETLLFDALIPSLDRLKFACGSSPRLRIASSEGAST